MRLWPRFRSRRAPATPADADRQALAQLRSLGADLTKARHVVHFAYFADAAGYSATVAPPDDTFREWRVHAEATRVLGETTVDGFRAWFERVARDHGGEYDGWEAARTP